VTAAGLDTTTKERKVLRHTLRHSAITWYRTPDRRTGKAVDIETVSLYCGGLGCYHPKDLSAHHAGNFRLSAAQTFGR
jgi:hypothetical protein